MRRGTHFYCLEPARLLHLVVDDRLVLVDALVAGSGEDHILIKRWKKRRVGYQEVAAQTAG